MVATRSASRGLTPALDVDTSDRSQKTSSRKNASTRSKRQTRAASGWSHAPTTTTLLWLAISLPLVAWDTGYVLGRPATMPGGWAHSPIWTPYELYGKVDHMYGFKQYNLGNGFTAAQGTLNVIETLLYLVYITIWYRAAPSLGVKESASRRRIAGKSAGLAVLVGFSASVMTVSKTILYWLNEYYSGFDNIGHNEPLDLLLLWIIPNGAWILVPSYLIYQFGSEILDAINIASRATGSVKAE
ncbi:hypothetical protein VPNG_03457 [Cytospora leucostoma]|uniref:EXPERA domain-containing protein n=1 Tax=Cytospora leucostoma TaxID=1230097 RepID=A0A423XFL7_9PEZI|nr:hypothetical protein VPNG_03457 [Cytospora leucostoma]